ncbi:MAG: H-NS histone family protein [Hydrogenophaga sp.]|nr:H-NS histone family protein [Hydrogenophaga sp.]
MRKQPLATQDISKLSYNELRKLADAALALAETKRSEEIKVLADGYAKKAAAGFNPQEAFDVLKPYLPRKGKGGSTVKYRDPADPSNTYGGKGKRPTWLREYIDAGRSLDEFAV